MCFLASVSLLCQTILVFMIARIKKRRIKDGNIEMPPVDVIRRYINSNHITIILILYLYDGQSNV